MKLLTKRGLIQDILGRWKEQYPTLHGDKAKIYLKLLALDLDTATEQEVEAVIGNGSWTRMICDECSEEVETLVVVGEEPGYESRTACICPDCLKKATKLAEEPYDRNQDPF